jgi:hemerythrin-like domain-containing protein
MRILEALRAEHDRIDRVLAALRGYVGRRMRGEASCADGARFVRFFRDYADGLHHAREEQVLLPSLARHLEVPTHRGPLAAIVQDHEELRATLRELSPLLSTELDAPAMARLGALTDRFTRALWLHIDAENSVLFPEAEERLPRAGVRELPEPEREPEQRAREEAARLDGDALIAAWPALPDPTLVRGEGCAICPSFGVRCDGIEREWWSEVEWEEFPHRVG